MQKDLKDRLKLQEKPKENPNSKGFVPILPFFKTFIFEENIFTIRSYEVTNKTIDSFSDIDEFTNSKNISNLNMSNIFDNVAKDKSLANRKKNEKPCIYIHEKRKIVYIYT